MLKAKICTKVANIIRNGFFLFFLQVTCVVISSTKFPDVILFTRYETLVITEKKPSPKMTVIEFFGGISYFHTFVILHTTQKDTFNTYIVVNMADFACHTFSYPLAN